MLRQWEAIEKAISSLIDFRPAIVSTSRLEQFSTMALITEIGSYGRMDSECVEYGTRAHVVGWKYKCTPHEQRVTMVNVVTHILGS